MGDGFRARRKAGGLPDDDIEAPLMAEDEIKGLKLHRQTVGIKATRQSSWLIPTVLTILSIWTRLYKIAWADYVVWDEAHFGKFASYYLRREFYFDVHPPLGKMLLGFAGILARYGGSFNFDSGAKYPDTVNYTTMRIFAALFGAGMVPLAYFTGLELHLSRAGAILLALMVLMDTATLTISRFILLDSMLLFFTSLTVYCFVTFRNFQRSAPFSDQWYFWMAATGVSLGCVASVKWVGLFAIALVGLHTVVDLWEMLGDLNMPQIVYIRHWLARIALLIVVPVSVYCFSFLLHFWILNKSGPGDAQMSSLFQAGLRGNDYFRNPIELAYGSKITLKNNGRGGGLLHSHQQKYPMGSGLQQVTCYHHKDSNNNWVIYHPWGSSQNGSDIQYVMNGDIIRLVHEASGKNLHSTSAQKAPVSGMEFEVSGNGNQTSGDDNDLWKVEIVDDLRDWRPKKVKALTTRIRLRHVKTNCLLRSVGVTLPEWGFKQAEVVCQAIPDSKSRNNFWNVEQHWNSKLPAGGANAFRRNFFRDLADLNVAMWNSNNALTPDPDREPDMITSSPYQWPLLLVGLRMCGWGDHDVKFFLMGHPIVWWGSTASLIVFVVLWVYYIIRMHRKVDEWKSPGSWDDFLFCGYVGLIGWFFHYIPFWIMGRVTYLHHYFPALYFAIILFASMIDHFTSALPKSRQTTVFAVIGVLVTLNFLYFADFAFGIGGPSKAYSGRRWLRSWMIYD